MSVAGKPRGFRRRVFLRGDRAVSSGLRMRDGVRSPGEQAFEQYLYLTGHRDYEYEPEDTGAPTHPDYRVRVKGVDVYCEVKEFEFSEQPKGFSYFDSRTPIREKITKAEVQFRPFRAHPCCLVLFNEKRLLFLDNVVEMFGVMYGDPVFRTAYDPEKSRLLPETTELGFAGRGKMRRGDGPFLQNTTFSALLVLRKVNFSVDRRPPPATHPLDFFRLGLIVYKNPFARIPLPEGLFTAKYDRVYGAVGEEYVCLSEGIGLRYEERRP